LKPLLIGPGRYSNDEFYNVLLNTLTTFEGSIVVIAVDLMEAMNVQSIDDNVTFNAQDDMIARKLSVTNISYSFIVPERKIKYQK